MIRGESRGFFFNPQTPVKAMVLALAGVSVICVKLLTIYVLN